MPKFISPPPLHWPARYIGIPWAWGGQGHDGVDCWGLVCLAWRELTGISLPTLTETIDHDGKDDMARQRLISKMIMDGEAMMRPIEVPRPLSILSIRHKSYPVHVGLYAHGGWVIEASEATGAVKQTRLEHVRPRIAGVYWPTDKIIEAGS